MEYDQKATGKRIAKLREEHGMSQDELGEALGLTGKHIGRVERGLSGLLLKNYVKVSELFSVSLDYLFTGALEKPLNDCVDKFMKDGTQNQQQAVADFLRALLNDHSEH